MGWLIVSSLVMGAIHEQTAGWNGRNLRRTGHLHECKSHTSIWIRVTEKGHVQVLAKKIRNIPGLNFDTSPGALSQSVGRLRTIAVGDKLRHNEDGVPKTDE